MPIASLPDNLTRSTGYDVDSVSRSAAMSFPIINYSGDNHFDPTHLKHIGVVVFKAFADIDNGGKINFLPVESFIGSLDRHERDPLTNANMFIDDIVNS